ncbi:MAG TPA: hypothetical protein VJN94_16370 [Candidatus Binataceae bacterium]|nr:hypothetical protein [Candidatus Binataceae bacterium]
MKKLALRMFGAGVVAVMAAGALPFSTAVAQDAMVQVRDPAAAVIVCSVRVEEVALKCKEGALNTLTTVCLPAATSNADDAACDLAALRALRECQAGALRGDLGCYFNPNGGGNPALQ